MLKVLLIRRDSGSLPTYKTELLAGIVNSWKPLPMNCCLKEYGVPESTNYNQITVCFFHGVLLGNDKCFFPI